MYLVNSSEIQEMDRETIESFGLPGMVLMENAGRGAFGILQKTFPDIRKKRVGVASGRGNNGGDGFVIARYLSGIGVKATVYLFAQRSSVKGDAATNLNLLDHLGVSVREITDKTSLLQNQDEMSKNEIWVDAIFGTGLNSEVKDFFKIVIDFLNSLKRPIVSVDIPSGLNADTAMPSGAVIRAHTTVTFGFPKTGHILFPGADFTGNLEIIDIGIPPHIVQKIGPKNSILTDETIKKFLPPRKLTSHKGTYGHVLVVAGSAGKAGAAAMTGIGALRSGAGLVTMAIPENINSIIQSQVLEAMTVPLESHKDGFLDETVFDAIMEQLKGKKCLAIGPGIGTAIQTKELVLKILQNVCVPVVLDADGLNCMANHLEVLRHMKSQAVLTPHPGEMSRLTGEAVSDIQRDRIGCARRFSQAHKVHLVLKGARTVIAHPDGTVHVNLAANPGMATGGMGDVLTGIISGLIAQGLTPEAASCSGVYLHGKSADLLSETMGRYGFLASDVASTLPSVIKNLEQG